MAILREDLFVAFFTAARSPNLATLSNVCQVALSLYAHLGSHLLLQVRTPGARLCTHMHLRTRAVVVPLVTVVPRAQAGLRAFTACKTHCVT